MDYRFRIARRYLISRRYFSLISVISGISIAGVTLGVAALVVVLSVMNGFYDFVREMLVSIDPHVRIVSDEGSRMMAGDSLLHVVREVDEVEHATPYVEGKALLLPEEGSEVNKVVIVRGVESSSLQEVSEVVEQTGHGRFDLTRPEGGLPGIVMGEDLAYALGTLPTGGGAEASTVQLLSAPALERLLTTVFGPPPVARFEVRGLYNLQSVYDQSHVFVGLEEAQRLFRMDSTITGIELRLDEIGHAEEVKAQLQQMLPAGRYRVQTWYDLQRSLYDVMRLEKWGASLILFLIVIVAAFNIVGSLTMIVIEKRRDVGVLQAMGVSPKGVRQIFLIEGLLVGGVGTALGLSLGLGLALLQKYYELVPLAGGGAFLIDAYPVSIRLLDLAVVSSVSVGLCLLASIYPARRAAAIQPARAVAEE